MRTLKIFKLPMKAFQKIMPKNGRSNHNLMAPSIIEAPPADTKSALHAPSNKHEKPKSKTASKEKGPPTPSPEECPICQDPVGISNPENIVESWTQLHCGHRFGTVCIQTWLQESLDCNPPHITPSCPVCRRDAKHPGCGHLICPQDDENHYLQNYMRAQYASEARVDHGRRLRRRLQRRDGHPLRPCPSPPPKRKVSTVGECTTCQENAAHDARVKLIAEHAQARQIANVERERRTSGIKAILPSHIRIRPSGTMAGEPSSPVDEYEDRGRVQTMYCAGNSTSTRAPREQTPAPIAGGRRGSI